MFEKYQSKGRKHYLCLYFHKIYFMITWSCKIFSLLGMGKLSVSGHIKGEKDGAREVETDKSKQTNKILFREVLVF